MREQSPKVTARRGSRAAANRTSAVGSSEADLQSQLAILRAENARLSDDLRARTQERQEAREYQTATSDVLNVISRSPTDVQPVFDMIASSAARLCQARFCHVFRFDGELVHFVAHHGLDEEGRERIRADYPLPPSRASAATRTILSGAVEEIPDVDADTEYQHAPGAHMVGFRSIVAVPMLKEGRPIGAMAVAKDQSGRFPRREVELLQTFADQAAIAIENGRLFEQLQARTRELSAALEQQTATTEVLQVISRSKFDLKPVLDAIVESANRLCDADGTNVWRPRDGVYYSAASYGMPPEFVDRLNQLTLKADGKSIVARALGSRQTVHLPDIALDPYYAQKDSRQLGGYRSHLAVPLLREGTPVGVLTIGRLSPRPFTQKQIDLVETFADQAVIAIENVRLFEEVQARTRELARSVSVLQALGEVSQAVNSTLDLETVLDTIVTKA